MISIVAALHSLYGSLATNFSLVTGITQISLFSGSMIFEHSAFAAMIFFIHHVMVA